MNHHYNKAFKPLGRALRRTSTKSEIRMWCELLRNKQMMGYSFLRQQPIDKYIADFFCKELNLVVELNGITHHWEETVIKDKEKQNRLEQLGYTVLRFDDKEVMKNIISVYASLMDWIDVHKKSSHSPTSLRNNPRKGGLNTNTNSMCD